MQEQPDIEVGVLTDRPDLDMLISIWVHGFVATRIHDVDTALEVVDRDGVLLIDQAATSDRSVIDELRDRDFAGPAVLFGRGGAELLEPYDRIVTLRRLTFSTMGQMLTLAQALTVAREGRANDPTVLRMIEGDDPEAAFDDVGSWDAEPAEAGEAGRFGEGPASAGPSHGSLGAPTVETGFDRLWARVRSLLGGQEPADRPHPPAADGEDEPHGQVSLLRDPEHDAEDSDQHPLSSEDDHALTVEPDDGHVAEDAESGIAATDMDDADALAEEVDAHEEESLDAWAAEDLDHGQPAALPEKPEAAEDVGRTALDLPEETGTPAEGEPTTLEEAEEIWQPLPPPSDDKAPSAHAPAGEERDEVTDVPGPVVTGSEEEHEPTVQQPVDEEVPADGSPISDALVNETPEVEEAQAPPEGSTTEATPTEQAQLSEAARVDDAETAGTLAVLEDDTVTEADAAVAPDVEESADDDQVPAAVAVDGYDPGPGAGVAFEPPEASRPPRPLPFVDSDESGRGWILLDRIDPVVLDGGAIVLVLDDRGRLAPIAATGVAPFEGAFTLPINHPLVVAAVHSGPVQLSTDRWLPVDDVPLSDCSVLVAVADKEEPRLLLIGSSRPFDEIDTARIVEAFEDRRTLHTVLRRVRPPVSDPPATIESTKAALEPSEEAANGSGLRSAEPTDAHHVDPAALRPWAVLNDADRQPGLGLEADRGFTRVVGDVAVAAWELLEDVHHLTEGGSALIAVRGTDGWYAPVATFRCEPVDAARSIPPRHPLLKRLLTGEGAVTVVNQPPTPSVASGLPLSFRAVFMAFAFGDPANPTALLLIGRARHPSAAELANIAAALREGRRPGSGDV